MITDQKKGQAKNLRQLLGVLGRVQGKISPKEEGL